ncbi:MAG TPA: ABC transporter permease [Gammaproteobacteria bacterium]|nr:ABC transporter permease [Gammaproteobacteria bacterium]
MNGIRTTAGWLLNRPWIWVFAAALLVWLVVVLEVSGRGAGGVLTVSLQFATFYVILGLGQMMVIATGPGNIDLSMPSVLTLAAYLSMGVMGGSDANLWLGVGTGVGVGLAAGVGNVTLIHLLRIPPMIATLAAGFIVDSLAMAYSTGSTAQPAPALMAFSTGRVLGVPFIAWLFIAVAALVAVTMQLTPFGRHVLAIGQNERAAYLAGVRIRRIRSAVFILSALAASICGILLAGASGGASLNMGEGYLLMSIAVVVLGGTSIFGGQVAIPGVWGAALLLYLIVSLLNVLSVTSGVRYLTIGLVIIAVLAVGHSGRNT